MWDAATELLRSYLSSDARPQKCKALTRPKASLAFARTRTPGDVTEYRAGNAIELPFPSGQFDVSVMALVLAFLNDPAKGTAEMARVTRPGGVVASYIWDMMEGGFPLDPILLEMQAMGLKPTRPPRIDASRIDAMLALWNAAGLEAVETVQFDVQRTFPDFEDFWVSSMKSPAIGAMIGSMTSTDIASLRTGVRSRLSENAAGNITHRARANAVKGRAKQL